MNSGTAPLLVSVTPLVLWLPTTIEPKASRPADNVGTPGFAYGCKYCSTRWLSVSAASRSPDASVATNVGLHSVCALGRFPPRLQRPLKNRLPWPKTRSAVELESGVENPSILLLSR